MDFTTAAAMMDGVGWQGVSVEVDSWLIFITLGNNKLD